MICCPPASKAGPPTAGLWMRHRMCNSRVRSLRGMHKPHAAQCRCCKPLVSRVAAATRAMRLSAPKQQGHAPIAVLVPGCLVHLHVPLVVLLELLEKLLPDQAAQDAQDERSASINRFAASLRHIAGTVAE